MYSLSALAIFICVWQWRPRFAGIKFPPGPKGYPIIGNVWDIPHERSWLTYAAWARKFKSDVVQFKVFGRTVILNSLKAATELLDKRSSIYSDRPRMVMSTEVLGWDWDLAHMHYTDRWRRHRRSFHQYFQPRDLASYYPVQRKVTVTFLEKLLQTPERFTAHIRQHAGSVVLRTAYGYEVKAENDFYIELAEKALHPVLSVVHAGAYMVDFIPALKYIPSWFPGATFKRNAKIWGTNLQALRDVPFQHLKNSIADGTAEQSYAYDSLEKLKAGGITDPEEEELIMNCAAIMYLALPHCLIKDDVYNGYLIPADALTIWQSVWGYGYVNFCIGTTVTANVWSILHDDECYPEPFKFDPDRFMQGANKGGLQQDPIAAGAFGFGRRICPGRHLAMNSAWIAMVSILSTYDISKLIDQQGNVVEPLIEFEDGLVCHPKPFDINIHPRSENTRKQIESAKL